MTDDNYKTPTSDLGASNVQPHDKYSSYDQVPIYRRQWFFWITYLLFAPAALAILLFGDIYYERKGRIVGFGIANRLVAGAFALYFMYLFGAGVAQS